MKVSLTYIVFILLSSGCTPTSKIDYGSNGGETITIHNRKIYFEEYGSGTPLILLSGGGINRSIRDFGECISALSTDYRVITPDSPGQGRSEQTDSLSYNLLADFMSQFIDSLKIDSCYVIGWSDGAIVSLLLAARRADKIKRVIAVGANNGMKGYALPDGFPLDSIKVPSMEYLAISNKKDIDWYNSIPPKKDWRKLLNNINRMVYQREYFPVSIYDSINIPVMIVLGDRDDISIQHGLEMHTLIHKSHFCVLPNTTHEVFADSPNLITQVARDFFKR